MVWPTLAVAAGVLVMGVFGLKAINANSKTLFPDLGAQAPGRIQVQVAQPDGRPITNATTELAIMDDQANTHLVGVPNHNGAVDVDLSKYGPMQHATLIAEVPGYGVSLEDAYPILRNAKLHMTYPAVVKGKILLPNGSPAAGVTVRPDQIFIDKEDNAGRIGWGEPTGELARKLSAKTARDGTFVIRGLPQNAKFTFEVDDSRFASIRYTQVSLGQFPESQHTPVVEFPPITLSPGFEIDGVVRRGGKPVAGVQVMAQEQNNSIKDGTTNWAKAVTDANGRYRLTKLRTGTYNVEVSLTDSLLAEVNAAALSDVEVSDSQKPVSMDFDLVPGGLIKGQVLHADGTGALTRVGLGGPATPSSSPGIISVRTNPDGTFLIHVPPGQQKLWVQVAPYSENPQTVDVKDGETSSVTLRVP